MAYTGDQQTLSLVFASAMGQYLPVFMNLASSRDRVAVPAGTIADDVIGLTRATVGTYGLAETVVVGGFAKAIAAASLGAGARVAVGSTNGKLIPITPSGIGTGLGSALGAADIRYMIGRSLEAAAAGAIFTVLLDPGQVV